jgi:hypothetical protein
MWPLEHYFPQGDKAKRTRSTPSYSQKELLSLANFITTIEITVKSSYKEKKKKVRSII